MCSVWLSVTLVHRALFWMCSVLVFCYFSASHNGLHVFCWRFVTLVPCALFGMSFLDNLLRFALCTVLYVFCWLFVTLVSYTLFCMWSVWLFGTLVTCALFWTCSVRFFVTLLFWALFWMCSVRLFVTLVSLYWLIVFCISVFHTLLYEFWFFVTSVFRALFLCVLLTACHVSVLRTVLYVFCWLFVTLVPPTLFFMCSVSLFNTLVPWTLFWICC